MSSEQLLAAGSGESGELAPFYPLPPALGKRAGMALLQGGRANPRSFCGAAAPQSGRARMSVSFEELDFRPTPMGVLSLRRRRRPMSDVDVYEIKLGDEFLMSSQFTVGRDRTGAARAGGARSRGSRRGGRRPRARLHRARGARKRRRAIADRGRCACRGHRMARAGIASARQGADRRSALPPRQRRLLRDVVLRRRVRSSFTGRGVSMPCWWISITRRASCCIRATPRCTSRKGWPGSPAISIRAACSRCGRTIRRMMRLSASWPAPLQPQASHVVTFDNLRGDHDASNTVYVAVKADLPCRTPPERSTRRYLILS